MAAFQIKSSAPQLLAKAREMTGIADIIDADIEERLTRLLHALNTEAELHEAGAAGMEQRLLRLLANRLRMLRDLRDHPEIDAQEIRRPVMITSGPRTGSTKLQKLLAASGDFIYLSFWQGHCLSLRTGKRGEDAAPRIRDADNDVRWFDEHAPQAKLAHAFETFEPEEESLVLEHCLCAPYVAAFVFIPSYVQWHATQDLRQDFEFLKQGLKYLQWQFHDGDSRPWVLKCPAYPGLEPMLSELFPGARFVVTHRNPASILSSVVSLLIYYHRGYSDAARIPVVAPMMLEGLAMQTEFFMAMRDSYPEIQYVDTCYAELTNDATMAARRVYDHAGMMLSERAEEDMRRWEWANAQHKLGVHRHALEEFGLTAEMVETRYRQYIERFAHCF